MHGLQHKVIEINVTENSEIEKILVFLRPGDHQINVANTRSEAEDILSKMEIVKTKPGFPKWLKAALILTGILIACTALVVFLL